VRPIACRASPSGSLASPGTTRCGKVDLRRWASLTCRSTADDAIGESRLGWWSPLSRAATVRITELPTMSVIGFGAAVGGGGDHLPRHVDEVVRACGRGLAQFSRNDVIGARRRCPGNGPPRQTPAWTRWAEMRSRSWSAVDLDWKPGVAKRSDRLCGDEYRGRAETVRRARYSPPGSGPLEVIRSGPTIALTGARLCSIPPKAHDSACRSTILDDAAGREQDRFGSALLWYRVAVPIMRGRPIVPDWMEQPSIKTHAVAKRMNNRCAGAGRRCSQQPLPRRAKAARSRLPSSLSSFRSHRYPASAPIAIQLPLRERRRNRSSYATNPTVSRTPFALLI
jgi:hypothetical protein